MTDTLNQTCNMETKQIHIVIYLLEDTEPELKVLKTSFVRPIFFRYRPCAQKWNASIRRDIIYLRATFTWNTINWVLDHHIEK